MLKANNRRRRIGKMPTLILVIALFRSGLCTAAAQTGPAGDPTVQAAQKLADEQRWQDLVLLLEALSSRSADLDFYYGTALARLQRWPQAESAFAAVAKLSPRGPRVSLGFAGGAFNQKPYRPAARRLYPCLRLAPPQRRYTL